jgi:hypothetical protein
MRASLPLLNGSCSIGKHSSRVGFIFVCLPLTIPSIKATCISDGPPVADQAEGASKLKEAEHDLPRQWLASPAELAIGTANPSTEVTQQSKARHKEDFLNAFSPFVADATSVAYKGAPADVQGKLRRVVDVWRERGIFDKEVMQDLYNRLSGECSNILPLLLFRCGLTWPCRNRQDAARSQCRRLWWSCIQWCGRTFHPSRAHSLGCAAAGAREDGPTHEDVPEHGQHRL